VAIHDDVAHHGRRHLRHSSSAASTRSTSS
jgi:hypothetical protein